MDLRDAILAVKELAELEERVKILGPDSLAAFQLEAIKRQLRHGQSEIFPVVDNGSPTTQPQLNGHPQKTLPPTTDEPVSEDGSDPWGIARWEQEVFDWANNHDGVFHTEEYLLGQFDPGEHNGLPIAGTRMYSALGRLKRRKLVKQIGRGAYELTPAGRKGVSSEDPSPRPYVRRFEKGGVLRTLVDYAKAHGGVVNMTEFKRHSGIVGGNVYRFVRDPKLFQREAEGVYRLVAEQQQEQPDQPPAPQASLPLEAAPADETVVVDSIPELEPPQVNRPHYDTGNPFLDHLYEFAHENNGVLNFPGFRAYFQAKTGKSAPAGPSFRWLRDKRHFKPVKGDKLTFELQPRAASKAAIAE